MIPLNIELPLSPQCIRQVSIFFVFQIQSAMPETSVLSGRHPRILARSFQPSCTFTFGAAVAVDRCVSLFLNCARPNARVRNFDTELPSSYRYELQPDHRLESIANAHTAADLHVRPWFSLRAEPENRGRCERFK
jgi:hypothetical protein